jgi:hypothetical protein
VNEGLNSNGQYHKVLNQDNVTLPGFRYLGSFFFYNNIIPSGFSSVQARNIASHGRSDRRFVICYTNYRQIDNPKARLDDEVGQGW